MEPSRFAILLRRHRIDCGLSQDALAEAAGISTSAVGAYERGIHSAPHRTTVRLLAEVLQLDGATRAEFEGAARRKPRATSQAGWIPPGNLPFPATSFVGRERELEQLQEFLARHRIVSLTGSGGIGKTRLALRAAAQRAATYQGGAWFVDFSKITDEALVVSQVAIALGLSVPAANSTIESFSAQLRERALLLILDNCEHVVGAAAVLAATIVRICPRVTILVTSRERLRISGEAVIRVPSLPTPGPATVTLADALTYPAVALFVERAATAEVHFVLTGPQLHLALDICRRLDGIPLAIELAAARLPTLGLTEIRNELNERFALLSIGPRDVAPRQQTLLATIDWSYDLLDESERALLRALSAFAGSFTLSAATAVFGRVAASSAVALLLSSLVDKSLLSAESDGGEDRYSMLESMRAYSRNKLDAGEADALMRSYARWAASAADEFERTRYTTSLDAWTLSAAREFDNVSVALTWALDSDRCEPTIAGRIVAGFRAYWITIGRIEDLCRLANELLERISPDTHPWIVARLHLCKLNAVDLEQRLRSISAARTLFERIGDKLGLAICYLYLADALSHEDPEGALIAADKAQSFAYETGMLQTITAQIGWLRAEALTAQRRFAEARILARQAIDDFANLGEPTFAAIVTTFLLQLEVFSGNVHDAAEVAKQLDARASELTSTLQSNVRVAAVLSLAQYRATLGELQPALAVARGVLVDHQSQWETYTMCAIECIAAIAALRGDAAGAARLNGFSNAHDVVRGIWQTFSGATCRRILKDELSVRLTADELGAHLADGALLSLDEAVAEALAASS